MVKKNHMKAKKSLIFLEKCLHLVQGIALFDFEELLCAGKGQGSMASLLRKMESGWVQLCGR